jgi:hypothetical protein
MAQLKTYPAIQVYRGTIDEVLRHRDEIPAEAQVELRIILPEKTIQRPEDKEPTAKPKQRVSVMGKYAGVFSSSEEFNQRKQEEIDRENRSRG